MRDTSPAMNICRRLIDTYGRERSHEIIDEVLDQHTNVELAAHEADWKNMWARSKQLPPDGDWATWGFLCGRGFGKTLSVSKFVNQEAMSGRAMLIGLAAQDEDNCIKLQIEGPSGLLATAPPWSKPVFNPSDLEVVWPNGAKAYVRTPEVPGKIRGLEYHLSWICELQSWPKATRTEALSNFRLSTRLGYARIVWDATAKKGHPILKEMLADAERNPTQNYIVRGSTRENEENLGEGYVARLEERMAGTAQGREELDADMSETAENALFRSECIEENRAQFDSYTRQVIGVDPAVTARAGSDNTGIIVAALTHDGRAAILADRSGKHAPSAWADIVIDEYTTRRCDLVIVETNKGGALLVQNLRACAKDRGLEVIVIGKDDRAPGHHPRAIHVREVYGKGAKEDRAQPVSTAYQRNRVCHPLKPLTDLEYTLTTWEPTAGARSPDRLDALVYAVIELLGLNKESKPDPREGMKGISDVAKRLYQPAKPSNLATMLGGYRGGRI